MEASRAHASTSCRGPRPERRVHVAEPASPRHRARARPRPRLQTASTSARRRPLPRRRRSSPGRGAAPATHGVPYDDRHPRRQTGKPLPPPASRTSPSLRQEPRRRLHVPHREPTTGASRRRRQLLSKQYREPPPGRERLRRALLPRRPDRDPDRCFLDDPRTAKATPGLHRTETSPTCTARPDHGHPALAIATAPRTASRRRQPSMSTLSPLPTPSSAREQLGFRPFL